jgi:hypothetical protein
MSRSNPPVGWALRNICAVVITVVTVVPLIR